MRDATEPHHLTAPERASFLAGQAVAAATGYLDGRSDGAELARETERVFTKLQTIVLDDARSNAIADVVNLLMIAMMNTATSEGARADRWAAIMAAFVPLLRDESIELARDGAGQQ
jgi:hypothetical protein